MHPNAIYLSIVHMLASPPNRRVCAGKSVHQSIQPASHHCLSTRQSLLSVHSSDTPTPFRVCALRWLPKHPCMACSRCTHSIDRHVYARTTHPPTWTAYIFTVQGMRQNLLFYSSRREREREGGPSAASSPLLPPSLCPFVRLSVCLSDRSCTWLHQLHQSSAMMIPSRPCCCRRCGRPTTTTAATRAALLLLLATILCIELLFLA